MSPQPDTQDASPDVEKASDGGAIPAHPDAAKLKAAATTAIAGVALAAAAAPAAQAAAAEPAAQAAAAPPESAVEAPAATSSSGVAKLSKMCGDSDAGVCKAPSWSEANLKFDAVLIGRYVNSTWKQIKMVGGWRPSDPFPDHPSGRAVDIMMPNGGKGSDKELGDEVARYFQEHAKEYGVDYILWRKRSWTAGQPLDKWKPMSDRGNPSANHIDHIHITTEGDTATIAEQLIEDGPDAGTSPVTPAEAAKRGDSGTLRRTETTTVLKLAEGGKA